MMKRLLIYFAYDENGILDDYIYFAIDKLQPFVAAIVAVINGKLMPQCKTELEKRADSVIVRDNHGFDVWAYKTAIDSIGWNGLMEYDEIILMNHTIMGPIYDLAPMFQKMEQRDLDFWGITKCFEEKEPSAVKLWKNPYGYIPEHIQSSFTVFRKRLFSSKAFHKLWDNMPEIKSYYESGGTYEQVITKKFSDLGYKWDCYTDYSSLDPEVFTCCPLITAPLVVVRDLKSPFFKRRSFFTSKSEFPTLVPSVYAFWRFLQSTNYDTQLVIKNLVRTCNQRDIVESLLMMHVINVTQSPVKSHEEGKS